jgi:hypothetical protein
MSEPLTPERFLTNAWLEYVKGGGKGFMPKRATLSPNLWKAYKANLAAFERIIPYPSKPLEEALPAPRPQTLKFKSCDVTEGVDMPDGWHVKFEVNE